jgi:hypothetical protein
MSTDSCATQAQTATTSFRNRPHQPRRLKPWRRSPMLAHLSHLSGAAAPASLPTGGRCHDTLEKPPARQYSETQQPQQPCQREHAGQEALARPQHALHRCSRIATSSTPRQPTSRDLGSPTSRPPPPCEARPRLSVLDLSPWATDPPPPVTPAAPPRRRHHLSPGPLPR